MEAESDPSSGTRTRRSTPGRLMSGGTTTSGRGSFSATSSAVVPTGCGIVPRAPTTSAATSSSEPSSTRRFTVGPVSVRSSSPAQSAALLATSSPSSPMWSASSSEPRTPARALAVATTGRAARLLSRAAITFVMSKSPPGGHVCRLELAGRRRGHPVVLDTQPDRLAAEARAQLERVPLGREPRIELEPFASWAERRRSPNASACQTPPIVARCSPPAVVPVRSSRSIRAAMRKRLERLVEPARAREQRRVDRRRERAAVRGPRLVELEVRHERAAARPRRERGGGASARRPA